MSAIAGIVHFDGAPVERPDLERMSQALQPFGRDGERIAVGGGFGFVVRSAHITPEDYLDRQPITLAGGGLLLFDGRLDNRPELIHRLGLGEAEGRRLADSDLAARAWERWGREGLIHLIGAFGLAHWNPSGRRLTLACSAPNGRPLHVHRRGQHLYFATAPHALFALAQVPRALNEAALGDLLLHNMGAGDTLYRDIALVQNAHWAEYWPEGSATRRYWAPDPERRLTFKREEAAWEAFHPLFETVVRSQLRAIHPVGVQMSGGLDSAAVAGQAARILAESGQILRGYTRVPAADTPLRPVGLFYNDERPRVAHIARMHPNLQTQFVDAGQEPVLDGMGSHFASAYATFAVPPAYLTGYQVLWRRAAADGVRVLLTGAHGNASFSYDGHARLRALLLSGRWPTLVHELRAVHRLRGGVRGLVKAELLEPFLPSVPRLLNRDEAPWGHKSAILGAFAERSGALERMRERLNLRRHWRRFDSWGHRAWVFSRTGLGGADAMQGQFGLERRDPAADRRLVEFCLALPDEFYLKDGIERRFARLGLAHLIPEVVRLDPACGRQDVDWALRMRHDAASITRALEALADDPTVGTVLDLPAMRAMWSGFEAIDWRHAPLREVVRYNQGLMASLAVGQFVRWFEGRN